MSNDFYLESDQAECLARLLADGQVWSVDKLRTALAREGHFVDIERMRGTMGVDPAFWTFADRHYASTHHLLNGVVLTHRLTAEELAASVLGDYGDIDPWVDLADEGLPFAEGGEVRARYSRADRRVPGGRTTGLELPPGSLDDFSAGDLIGLRYVDGALRLELVTLDHDGTQDRVDSFLELADRLITEAEETIDSGDDEDESRWDVEPDVITSDVLMNYRRLHPESFQNPVPPLHELLGERFAWDGLAYWHQDWEADADFLGDDAALAEEEAGWRLWVSLSEQLSSGVEPDTMALEELAIELVAWVDELAEDLPQRRGARELVNALASTRFATAQPAVTAAVLSLRATLAELDRDTPSRLSLLEEAVRLDAHARLAHEQLADLKSIAGDAAVADKLYRSAGFNNQDLEIIVLRDYLTPPKDGPGRNKPCPCGSGKKYKVCHGRTASHSLTARTPWLGFKLKSYAHNLRHGDLLVDWACTITGRDVTAALRATSGHPLLDDLLLFGSGLLAAFREEFAGVLPDDEDALLAEWATSRRSLFEVTTTRLGEVELRDLLTDESSVVIDWALSREVAPKDVLFTRLVSDGAGGTRVFAEPMLIPRLGRGPLLALLRTDPDDEAVARHFAVKEPVITNRDGQELVDCVARYRVADLNSVWPHLVSTFQAGDGDADPDPDLITVTDAEHTIRAWLRRRGDDDLRVHTNSIERLREVQATVLHACPEAMLISESSQPISTPEALPAPAQGVVDPTELPAEALQEIVAQHTESWLVSNLPALGGLTPVEAAQGSDRDRSDLAALLDDFDWQQRRDPGPFGMDIDGLRAKLGITKR